jgi:hypothetical protein
MFFEGYDLQVILKCFEKNSAFDEGANLTLSLFFPAASLVGPHTA